MRVQRVFLGLMGVALLGVVTGCPKKKDKAPEEKPTPFAVIPEGGSSSLPGKIRDRAVERQISNDLKQLALFYIAYDASNSRGPASAEEWLKGASPDEKALVKQTEQGGKYVFNWKLRLSQLPRGTSDTILGYEARTPKEGGMVVMADGSVKKMSAKEFAEAGKP